MNNKLKLVPRPKRYQVGGPLVIDWNKPQETEQLKAVKLYGKQQADYTRSKIRTGVQNHNRYKEASKKNADIAKLQRELYYGDYYGPNVSYNQAVDGVMDKMTQEALKKQERERIIKEQEEANSKQSGSLLGKPVQVVLDNMYPFGYDDSLATAEAKTTFVPKLSKKLGNIVGTVLGEDAGNTISSYINSKKDLIAQGVGLATKVWKGVTGTDKAGNAAREFAALDLSKPEDRKRAEELYAIMVKEEPKWGLRGGNLDRIQFAIRGRMDQNAIYAGQPQRYNTYTKANGYTMNNGAQTWALTDTEKNEEEKRWARNYMKNHKPRLSDDGKHYIYDVEYGDPYAQHGQFSIITDLDGSHARTNDLWDFGKVKHIPGEDKVYVGTYIDE